MNTKLRTAGEKGIDNLAQWGFGAVVYVRAVNAAEIKKLFPMAPGLAGNARYFAVMSADGTPIMLTDTWEAAAGQAWANDMEVASLH